MTAHHEDLFVHDATIGSLLRFLDPQVPWVWIAGHMPNPTLEWWESPIVLNTSGAECKAQIRALTYDMQLPTAEFIAHAEAFEANGIDLVQCRGPIPNTLELSRVTEAQRSEVLRLNGAFLYIHLPHAVETALVRCFQPGYLERIASA
jgi:hypothetical protein